MHVCDLMMDTGLFDLIWFDFIKGWYLYLYDIVLCCMYYSALPCRAFSFCFFSASSWSLWSSFIATTT